MADTTFETRKKSPRIVLTLKPEVREALRTGIFYELAGIQQGKTFYKDLKAYKDANGQGTPTGGDTTPPSGDETPAPDTGDGDTPGGEPSGGGLDD